VKEVELELKKWPQHYPKKQNNMCDCQKIIDWIETQQNQFPEENLEDSQVYAYTTLEMIKRQIEIFANEEKQDI
jgi:hypothetical protein